MSPKETADALGALAALREFGAETGRRFTVSGAVSEFTSALRLLGDRPLGEALRGFLTSVATVARKDVGEAVREFLTSRALLTKATNGDRPQLGGKYTYNLEIQLTRFAAMSSSTRRPSSAPCWNMPKAPCCSWWRWAGCAECGRKSF